jgi:hypothetical protein
MSETFKIVTICGSMRFYDTMVKVAEQETAAGHIVLMPFCAIDSDEQNGYLKSMLDRMHFAKIDMCDHIIVVTDENGYVGTSTRREMAYAIKNGKLLDGTLDVRDIAPLI